MATLLYRSLSGLFKVRVLDPADTLYLGRDPGCDLVFTHPTVSRRHAAMSFHDDGFYLEDLGSRNRVFVNGEPVSGRIRLREGDTIVLGFDQDNGIRFSEASNISSNEMIDLSEVVSEPLHNRPFHLLFRVSEAMTTSQSMIEVFELVLQGVLEISSGSRAMILLKRDAGDLEVAYRVRTPEAETIPDHVFSRSVIQRVLETGRPFLVHDTAVEPAVRSTDSVAALKLHTIVAIPLFYSENYMARQAPAEGMMGLIYVDGQGVRSRFRHDDIDLLLAFSRQAAIAMENAELHLELRDSYVAVVTALAGAVELKDRYTRGHSELVARYACCLAERLQLQGSEVERIARGGILHDVGKIGVREHILNKPGKLTPEEFDEIKRHPLLGEQILRPVSSLASVLEIVRSHHERLDGTGYPHGLKDSSIGLDVRIVAVADVFEALTADRSYRPAMEPQAVIHILEEEAVSRLDSGIVQLLIDMFRESGYRKELIRPQQALPSLSDRSRRLLPD